MLRWLTFLWSSLALLASPARAADWVYFDLGEVILTGKPATGYTFVPGALASIQELHQAGYEIGMISNTPEAWGATCSEKFAFLQNFIAPRLKESRTFPWSAFHSVVLPPFDRYRKPQAFMFLQGLAQACPGRTLYIGESQNELDAAKRLGYATYLKGGQPVIWPGAADVKKMMDEQFNFTYPSNCDLRPSIAASLLDRDHGIAVPGCINVP